MRSLILPLALLSPMLAAEPPPEPAALLAKHTYAFTYTATSLAGAGADFLREKTARSQFVLLGEAHMDHEVPIFAGGLFGLLHATHGFRHLVVEQDPLAIEDALADPRRGDAEKLAAHARRYPSLFEFPSDQDLTFLANVSRLVPGPDAIWGVEQVTGAVRYLEELVSLAPSPEATRATEVLLAAARSVDPGPTYTVNWLASTATPPVIATLTSTYHATPDSRAARLLAALAKSAEVFNYYTRAEAGEFVGLYNNTVREEILKGNFLHRYRAVVQSGSLPKAMFKFGSNHLYHGRNPTNAFPIGNLAHELAIANGLEGLGINVVPLGPGYVSYKDLPGAMIPLLPAVEPTVPTLIDLRPLRPYQRLFRLKLANQADAEEFRTLIHGYDAIVLLPNSKPATMLLGGRSQP